MSPACLQRVLSVSSAFRANVDCSVKSAGRGCGPAKKYVSLMQLWMCWPFGRADALSLSIFESIKDVGFLLDFCGYFFFWLVKVGGGEEDSFSLVSGEEKKKNQKSHSWATGNFALCKE